MNVEPASPHSVDARPLAGGKPGRALETAHGSHVLIQLNAHNSLSPRQAKWFLITVAVGPILTAAYCVWSGFWPVLPFAGLEMVLLYVALRWSMRRGRQRQSIEISSDSVLITTQLMHEQAKTRFPRHWTRVRLRSPRSAWHPSRLCLESGGRSCEVGRFLTEDERRALAARLQQLVGNMNESPEL